MLNFEKKKNPFTKLPRRFTAGSSMVSFQPGPDAFSTGNQWALPAVIRQGHDDRNTSKDTSLET